MGTDIRIHVEYLDCKTKQYTHANEDFRRDRCYLLFDLLGGGRGNKNPLYYPRGLPGDLSDETLRCYKYGESEFHHASWLTTMEFRECLDAFYETPKEDNIPEDLSQKLDSIMHDLPSRPDPMICYEQIYCYMKSSDDDGEPSRIVFWFDN